jgi:hypothetical protein
MDFVETIIDNDILYKSKKDINVYYSSDQHHDNSVEKKLKIFIKINKLIRHIGPTDKTSIRKSLLLMM